MYIYLHNMYAMYTNSLSVVSPDRSVTPLHSTFIVPQPLSQYLEILPKHGLVQGESSFAAQLKFLPTKDLLATDYVNPASGLLQAPVTVSVTGQVSLIESGSKHVVIA